MRLHAACVASLLACGSVRNDPVRDDAGASGDAAMACTIHDSIASCGPQCATCAPADDRQTPTCNGTACDVACRNAAPRCTDNTCSRLTWNFDSNMLDGIAPRAPTGLALAVQNHAGNLALAVEVADLVEIAITIPLCLSGSVQLQSRTLTATVYFQGDDSKGTNQYYVQAAVPVPMTGAFLITQDMPSLAYVTYTAPLNMSQFSNTATTLVFKAGSFGAHFSGTIWFDDIKIQ